MATLGDLKTRIRRETNKDDIASGGESEGALTEAIANAIRYYAEEPFWFNRAGAITSAPVTTVANQGYIAAPAAVRVPDVVTYLGVELEKYPLDDIEGLVEVGQPVKWAANGDSIQLYPIPGGAYTLQVFGVAQIAAPTLDPDSTVWTNEAYDLIAARVRFLLFRDTWRDTKGAQIAAAAEDDELTTLRRKTRLRSATPLRAKGDEPWCYGRIFDTNLGDF